MQDRIRLSGRRFFPALVVGGALLCRVATAWAAEPAGPGNTVENRAMTKYFTRYLDPDREHPYLLVSREELAEVARRLFNDKEPLLTAAYETVSADAAPGAAEGSRNRFRQAGRTLNAAYLCALHEAAGDAEKAGEYAESARAALLAFAELGVPQRSPGTGYLTHNYLISLAFAYDLVWNAADWTEDQRLKMRDLFHASLEDLVPYMHAKHLSNHAAWAQCRVATTAFLFKDEALAAECLDGPDGYAERIAHEFFDDGMNYEQSTWQYHIYSLLPVTITGLAARGAGAVGDPLTLKVKNDLSLTYLGGTTGDYTMPFYPADTAEFPRPAEKTLAGILTAQFEMLRPDTTCPSIGDYGGPTPRMADQWLCELVWDLFGDERAARLLSLGERKADGAHIFPEGLLTLAFGRALPEAPRFDSVSTIYPHSGYAVMKSVEGDEYWGSDSIQAVLSFGPFGNGHGQADKLSLEIAGAGRKCCIEELHRPPAEWQYWNSTVSHNSVVVGEKSQPGNEEIFTTGIDSCGRLVFRRFEPDFKVACAEAPAVYEGLTTYRRTVAVADSYVVDVFEVAAAEPTVFDWFLHGMEGLVIEGAALEDSQIGNSDQGYEFLTEVHSGEPEGAIAARFGCGHAVFVPEAAEFEVFSANGPWKKDATRPALILRKAGVSAVFAVVHDPSGSAVDGVTLEKGADGSFSMTIEVRGRRDRVDWSRGESGNVDILYSTSRP